jgi:AhpD family alkylhydroperoxidase
MTDRIAKEAIYKLQPAIAQNLRALGEAAVKSGLEISLIELVKLRASQINGCAYCVNMHSADARKYGERQDRLDLLPVWREAPCFSKREEAALAWTEALTTISHGEVSDALYATVSAQFSDVELINLTAAVVAINSWNRIAVPFRFVPSVEPPSEGRPR